MIDPRFKRSWTLIFHAACKMREQAHCFSDGTLDKLTLAQERVMGIVFQHSPEGIKLKEIAKIVQLTPGAVSQIIEVLVNYDLVERSPDPTDRRALKIHVSRKSEEQRTKMVGVFDNYMEKIFSECTPEQGQAFLDLMEKIVNQMPVSRESIRRFTGDSLLAMEEYE